MSSGDVPGMGTPKLSAIPVIPAHGMMPKTPTLVSSRGGGAHVKTRMLTELARWPGKRVNPFRCPSGNNQVPVPPEMTRHLLSDQEPGMLM